MILLLVGPHYRSETITLEGGGCINIRCGVNVPPMSAGADSYRGWMVEVREITASGQTLQPAYCGKSWFFAAMAIHSAAERRGHWVEYETLQEICETLAEWQSEAEQGVSLPKTTFNGTKNRDHLNGNLRVDSVVNDPRHR